jgi:hypothetical protein
MANSRPKSTPPVSTIARSAQLPISDPQFAGSLIFGIGTAAWKVVSAWSNIDFLLSIKAKRFADIFEFFEHTGMASVDFICRRMGAN